MTIFCFILGPYAEEEIAFMDGNNEEKVLTEPTELVVKKQVNRQLLRQAVRQAERQAVRQAVRQTVIQKVIQTV